MLVDDDDHWKLGIYWAPEDAEPVPCPSDSAWVGPSLRPLLEQQAIMAGIRCAYRRFLSRRRFLMVG